MNYPQRYLCARFAIFMETFTSVVCGSSACCTFISHLFKIQILDPLQLSGLALLTPVDKEHCVFKELIYVNKLPTVYIPTKPPPLKML